MALSTEINNNPYAMVGGWLSGTISPGKKSAVNGGKALKITNERAALFAESLIWTVVDDTNFVQQSVGGSLVVNVLSNITAQVIQPQASPQAATKNLYLSAGVGSNMDPYSRNWDGSLQSGHEHVYLQGQAHRRQLRAAARC